MNIVLITPDGPTSRTGNKVAASRWARILRGLGHRVRVAGNYDGRPADLMVAVHAWRSARAIERFKAKYPDRPLVLQLSGTDIYDYIERDPAPTLRSMELADRLVALNDLAWRVVPRPLRVKLLVLHQSANPIARRRRATGLKGGPTIVSVIGHLRDVKDPLRAAEASRRLAGDSGICIVQVGRAYTPQWAARARAEMAANPRYRWRGDVPAADVRRLLAQSHAMVISSLSEGGANVVSEAAVSGVPILASRIDGNVGLLGRDYPGYFAAGDTAALARLLRRLESEPSFVRKLERAVKRRAPLFRPAREIAAWRRLLAEIGRRIGHCDIDKYIATSYIAPMPRIRNIHPDYPHSHRMPEVSREARYLKLLLSLVADDEGRFLLDPPRLAERLFPGDFDAAMSIRSWFGQLEHIGALERYSVDGADYGRLVRWHEEQTICHPKASALPPSPNEPPAASRISRNSRRRPQALAKTQADQAVGEESAAILEGDVFSAGEPDLSSVIGTFKRIGENAEADGSHTAALRAAELVAKFGGITPVAGVSTFEGRPRTSSPAELLMEDRVDVAGGEKLLAPHEYFGLPSTRGKS